MGTERTRPTTDEADRNLLADIAGAKATHTPGLWRVSSLESDNRTAIYDVMSSTNDCIATCWSAQGCFPSQANASLMAAAPDLLAACKLIVAAHPINGNTNCAECTASRAAQAAIAKAGGVA